MSRRDTGKTLFGCKIIEDDSMPASEIVLGHSHRCPNCGCFHLSATGNRYCETCSRRLGRLTGFGHIDEHGLKSLQR